MRKESFVDYEGHYMASTGLNRREMKDKNYSIRRCYCDNNDCRGWEVIRVYKFLDKVAFTRRIHH